MTQGCSGPLNQPILGDFEACFPQDWSGDSFAKEFFHNKSTGEEASSCPGPQTPILGALSLSPQDWGARGAWIAFDFFCETLLVGFSLVRESTLPRIGGLRGVWITFDFLYEAPLLGFSSVKESILGIKEGNAGV